ncbi:unnamed protein product [Brugia timori]|uniref:TPX2_importin domain-containing protein n=1 Tax=Brugia timori TaxID=42155 RepID=A0A0R3QYJ4_9BILA|nr:unnamed protein product [Brugia timori]
MVRKKRGWIECILNSSSKIIFLFQELLHLLATDISKDKSQQFMMRDASQKISPSDFSFTLTDKDKPSSSTVKTTQITAARKVVGNLLAPLECHHSSSPSFTFIPQKNSFSSLLAAGEKEFQNFMCYKKASYEVSEKRETHQPRLIPYSFRKAKKEAK